MFLARKRNIVEDTICARCFAQEINKLVRMLSNWINYFRSKLNFRAEILRSNSKIIHWFHLMEVSNSFKLIIISGRSWECKAQFPSAHFLSVQPKMYTIPASLLTEVETKSPKKPHCLQLTVSEFKFFCRPSSKSPISAANLTREANQLQFAFARRSCHFVICLHTRQGVHG